MINTTRNMQFKHGSKFILISLVLAGCVAQNQKQSSIQTGDSQAEKYLQSGYNHLSENNSKLAMAEFDNAIAACEQQYSENETKVYTSRGINETLFYMAKAAVEKQAAVAVAPTCSDALYFKGYTSVDLNQLDKAEEYISRAVKMAPMNSMYLSELGHIYQTRKQWQKAFEIFKRSEEAATTFSPSEVKIKELTRAKRAVGFALVELGKLDEAITKYKECLEIDSSDEAAKSELKYIDNLRKNGVNPI